jgi:hypothetical protein
MMNSSMMIEKNEAFKFLEEKKIGNKKRENLTNLLSR